MKKILFIVYLFSIFPTQANAEPLYNFLENVSEADQKLLYCMPFEIGTCEAPPEKKIELSKKLESYLTHNSQLKFPQRRKEYESYIPKNNEAIYDLPGHQMLMMDITQGLNFEDKSIFASFIQKVCESSEQTLPSPHHYSKKISYDCKDFCNSKEEHGPLESLDLTTNKYALVEETPGYKPCMKLCTNEAITKTIQALKRIQGCTGYSNTMP